ncbi:DUF3040 domain-containing protein [Nonomuraea sp. NPDC004580]|uniref:DUF3040 domain-containing protein n=1 Tax=Nonomuraea sp. NPDC004580 TaxID=3154552 RepID=UPI0033A76D8D
MHLSDRERRILAEIELDLRRSDPAFARRIDALSAAARRKGFGSRGSRREIAGLLAAVAVLTTVMVFVVILAGHAAPPPAGPQLPPVSQVENPLDERGQ